MTWKNRFARQYCKKKRQIKFNVSATWGRNANVILIKCFENKELK